MTASLLKHEDELLSQKERSGVKGEVSGEGEVGLPSELTFKMHN
jgi:hypothetical protein